MSKVSTIHVLPEFGEEEVYQSISPHKAGWELLSFLARNLGIRRKWEGYTEKNEIALVILGGTCDVHSSKGTWLNIGRREDVFHGMPYTLYLPNDIEFRVEVVSDQLDIACGWCPATTQSPARLVRPDDVKVEIRGGGNATRQINHMIPPGFPCERLVVCEVYTPPGNWSSYPPHKHDQHKTDEQGRIVEADLEEIYFYKMNPIDGFAYQRVYDSNGSLDEIVMARHNDIVLVPEGYHPVVSGHGYTTYYLNFLAGSAQSLASSDDPQYSWIKGTWRERDARVPVVSMEMEK